MAGQSTTMVSVGVATSCRLCAGAVPRATSSISSAPGWHGMPWRRILYSWYTLRRIWYAIILTPG
eukprot:SAG31_NODE_151_length_22216_cov_37.572139_8_plen_65_part_00